MQENTSRQKILNRIKIELGKKRANNTLLEIPAIDQTSPIYFPQDNKIESLLAKFGQELTNVNGKLYLCSSEYDFIEQISQYLNEHKANSVFCTDAEIQKLLKQSAIQVNSNESELLNLEIAITPCECLVARLGSVVVSSRLSSGRRQIAYAPIHIVVGYISQFVYDVSDAFELLQTKYGAQLPSSISIVTGPSRTADIEKTLILGAHGPKELIVFLIR